jgi:hypothetical protein
MNMMNRLKTKVRKKKQTNRTNDGKKTDDF